MEIVRIGEKSYRLNEGATMELFYKFAHNTAVLMAYNIIIPMENGNKN